MLLPKRHPLALLQPDPIRQPVRVLRDPPERAVFDLDDLEVDGFGVLVRGVLDDDADGAGGVEVVDCLRGEHQAGPVCDGVLSYGGEGAGHGGEGKGGSGAVGWAVD